MKITEKEHEKTISDKKNKLVAGTKEILVLFEEANGLWINLQGKDRKDRKEQIEKYKSICENEGKEYKEPTSVKSELKLHVSYEGWKKDDKRHSLVNNKLNNEENIKEYNNVYLEPQNPIYQVLKQTPISELEYII